MNNKGIHALADIYLKNPVDDAKLKELCREAINKSGMVVVAEVDYNFSPQGITAVWVLAESHFTLHTYPEINYLSVDCYTCGDKGKPMAAIDYLLSLLNVDSVNKKQLERG